MRPRIRYFPIFCRALSKSGCAFDGGRRRCNSASQSLGHWRVQSRATTASTTGARALTTGYRAFDAAVLRRLISSAQDTRMSPRFLVQREGLIVGKPDNTGIMRALRAARFSAQGLAHAWRHESVFRQELTLGIILTPLALWLGQTAYERLLLIACLLLSALTRRHRPSSRWFR